jgi:hypothetical protein
MGTARSSGILRGLGLVKIVTIRIPEQQLADATVLLSTDETLPH